MKFMTALLYGSFLDFDLSLMFDLDLGYLIRLWSVSCMVPFHGGSVSQFVGSW